MACWIDAVLSYSAAEMERERMRASMMLLLPVMGLVACSGGGKDSSSDSSEDSGPTETLPNYEAGCITVDGGGGYKYIQDSISVAKEGSEIVLCNGTYEEAVVVDKGVSIVGESREGVILQAPANSAAFTITATGASVKSFTIQTSKDGIVFDGATNSSASDFTVNAPPNYGVAFNNAVSSSIEDCTIDTPGYTGVKIAGGSPTVTRCSVPHATSYAITVGEAADATFDSNTFDGVVATTDEDGFAFRVDTATAHFSHNQFLSADVGAISADTSALTMDGDTITNAQLGVLAYTTDLDAKGVTITESAVIGMLVTSTGTISVADSTISVTDGSACENPYAKFWSTRNPSVACGGLVAVGATVNLSNLQISNYNTYGIYTGAYDADAGGAITMDGVTVSNVGRMGMIVLPGTGGTVAIHNSAVDGTREPELVEPCGDQPSQTGSYQLNYSPAVYGSGGTWTVDGMSVTNSAGWGLALAGATTTLTNSTIDTYKCAGVINLQGTLNANHNTFTHGAQLGGIWDYQGSSIISDNTFVDNHAISRYDYSDGSYYESNGGGQDIQGGQSAEIVVTNNSFTSGDQSLLLSEVGSATVSDNTWTEYDSAVVAAYGSGKVTMERNVLTSSYGQLLSASGGDSPQEVEISDLLVSDSRPSHQVYGQYNADGTPVYSGDYYSSSSEVVYAYSGALDIQDLTVENSDFSYPIFVYNSSLAVDGATVDSASYFVYGYWYDSPPDALLQDVNIGTLNSSLIYATNNTGSTGSVYLSDVTVDTAYQIADVRGKVDVTVDGVNATNVSGNAFYFGSTTSDTDGDGLYELLLPTGVALSNISIDDVGGDGVYAELEQLIVSNVEFGSAQMGIYVTTSQSSTTGGGYPYDLTNTPAYVEVSDLRLGTIVGDALYVQAAEASYDNVTLSESRGTAFHVVGDATVQNSTVTAAATGVTASGNVVLDGNTLGTITGNGVEFTGSSLTIDDLTLGSSGGYGVYATGTDLEILNSNLGTSVSDAMYLDGSTIVVSGVTGVSSGGNGLSVYTGAIDVTGNTFSGNAGYGMVCGGVTTNSCSTNDLSNNTLGASSGCDEACGI